MFDRRLGANALLPADDAATTPLRPKRLSLRPARWVEEQGVWRAEVGPWLVQVAPSEARPGTWDWRAFSTQPGAGSKAIGGGRFQDRPRAQADAEAALADA